MENKTEAEQLAAADNVGQSSAGQIQRRGRQRVHQRDPTGERQVRFELADDRRQRDAELAGVGSHRKDRQGDDAQ